MLLQRRADKVEAIRKVPLFSTLSKRELDLLAKSADEIQVPADRVLVRQGENARELIVIVDGTARVERSGHVIAHQGPGDFIGEMGLVDGRPRSATVKTDTPCTLLVIESRSFWLLLEQMPQLSRKIMATLSERVRALETRYID